MLHRHTEERGKDKARFEALKETIRQLQAMLLAWDQEAPPEL